MTHLADELVLVDAARAGNSDAFASLVGPYNQNVYRLAVNITHNHEDAEDVRQEALIKAYSKPGAFSGRIALLYLAGPHRAERGPDEAPQEASRQAGLSRRVD